VGGGRQSFCSTLDAVSTNALTFVSERFWRGLQDAIPVWDRMIEEFNARTGLNRPG